MDNKYLCLFDENGRRGETHLSCEYSEEQKQEMLEAGYVEISQDEWDIYVGNKGMGDNGTGYVRGKDGKPISAPAHVPSKDEKLAVLDSQYDADKAELTRYFAEAMLAGDDDLMAELREEMAGIDEAYEAERQAILNG